MKFSRSFSWFLSSSFVILVLASGCQFADSLSHSVQIPLRWRRTAPEEPVVYQPTFSSFVSPVFHSARLKRIVLIETGPDLGSYGESKKMVAELATGFRSAGLFEVVTLNQAQPFSNMDAILQGRFNERDLAALSRQYNADAIGFVRVNELRGFSPMRAAITLAIVDNNESIVTYALDGTWDTAHQATQTAFHQYVKSQSQLSVGLEGVQLQSPRALMGFASRQITENIASSMR